MNRLDQNRNCLGAQWAVTSLLIGMCACSDKNHVEAADPSGLDRGKVAAPERDLGAFVRCNRNAGVEALSTLMVDDFEHGLRTVGGPYGSWISFNDGSKGSFTWLTTPSEPKAGSLLHVTSNHFGEWSGFGVEAGSALGETARCALDASSFKGIRFVARGKGELRVRASTVGTMPTFHGGTCPNGEACFDQPGAFVHLTSEPRLIELPFCGMRLQGLYDVEPAHWDVAEFLGVNFMILDFLQQGGFEMWLDDLELYTEAASATDADCQVGCPLQSAPVPSNIVPEQSSLALNNELTVATFEQTTGSCGKLTRRYLSYVPDKLGSSTNAPVLMMLHGFGANAESMVELQTRGRLNKLASEEGFVVVYGNAAPGFASSTNPHFQNTGAWHHATNNNREVDDVDYLKRVLADLEKRGLISDKNDVFLAGHSDGGGMALKAAAEMSERLSGLALFMPYVDPVAAVLPELSSSPLSHVLFVHALGDPGLPKSQDVIVAQQPRLWAQALQLSTANPTVTPVANPVGEGADYKGDGPIVLLTQHSSVVQTDYKDKGKNAVVRDLSIQRGGHFLPSSVQDTDSDIIERWGLRNQDIDASEVMWEFFKTRVVR